MMHELRHRHHYHYHLSSHKLITGSVYTTYTTEAGISRKASLHIRHLCKHAYYIGNLDTFSSKIKTQSIRVPHNLIFIFSWNEKKIILSNHLTGNHMYLSHYIYTGIYTFHHFYSNISDLF